MFCSGLELIWTILLLPGMVLVLGAAWIPCSKLSRSNGVEWGSGKQLAPPPALQTSQWLWELPQLISWRPAAPQTHRNIWLLCVWVYIHIKTDKMAFPSTVLHAPLVRPKFQCEGARAGRKRELRAVSTWIFDLPYFSSWEHKKWWPAVWVAICFEVSIYLNGDKWYRSWFFA